MAIKTELLSTKQAAPYLGCAVNSLKLSRTTGQLFSVQAPAYIKMGAAVRYKLSTIEEWLKQFTEQSNTAQSNTAQ